LALALGWTLPAAWAASYYVDFAGGSDSRTGTSKDTAWKRCPGDEAATGIPAATPLKPGDIVYFKGGVVYLGGITLSASGQSGQEISFDGNHSGSWGPGRAVLDRGYEPSAVLASLAGVSHWTIRGFEIRNSGGYADDAAVLKSTEPLITAPPAGTGVSFWNGGHKNIRLENLFIHRIGQWRNQLPFSGTNSITGTGISLQNCEEVVVKNCELTKMRTAISIKATSAVKSVTVEGCDIHDYIVWGIDVAPRKAGAVLENIEILNTSIRDYHQYDKGNWLGAGEKPHTDGIFLRTAAMASTWKNITVANCFFYTDNPGSSQGGTASIYVSQGPSVNIYNNLFVKDPHSRAIGIGHSNPSGMAEQIVRIYNNTFIEGPSHILLAGEADPARCSVYIQNNIFCRNLAANSVMVNHQSGAPPKVLDNNLYWSDDYSPDKKSVAYMGGYKTFAQLKAMGYEKGGVFGNPGFAVSAAPSAAQLDLRPMTGAAVAGGFNLSAFFSEDRFGLQRPKTGAWNVGAYLPRGGGPPQLIKPTGYLPAKPPSTN